MTEQIYIRPIALDESPQSEEGEAVRLAVRRCATLWTGKKPIVDVSFVEVG